MQIIYFFISNMIFSQGFINAIKNNRIIDFRLY